MWSCLHPPRLKKIISKKLLTLKIVNKLAIDEIPLLLLMCKPKAKNNPKCRSFTTVLGLFEKIPNSAIQILFIFPKRTFSFRNSGLCNWIQVFFFHQKGSRKGNLTGKKKKKKKTRAVAQGLWNIHSTPYFFNGQLSSFKPYFYRTTTVYRVSSLVSFCWAR